MCDATRVVRAGLPEPAQGEPLLPGPTFAGPYHFCGEVGDAAHTYGRYSNPTWTRFEQALGELEDGYAVVFSSGMAAVVAPTNLCARPDRGASARRRSGEHASRSSRRCYARSSARIFILTRISTERA